MRKRLIPTLLALCMVLALLPTAFAANSASAGYSDSGSTAMTKLTKLEIAQLLNANPLTLPSNVFETEPSYTSPYAPGKVKQEALQAALNRLNALRRIAGLPSVALDSEWCSSAQYGAVLLSVSEFSHYPSQPADMDNSFYSIGRSATSSSNISGGRTLTGAIGGFMDDSDGSNVDRLGHRRWQLNPYATKVGFGYAAHGYYRQYVAEKVFNGYSSSGNCDFDFIAWPASGNFPYTLFGRNVAWSVTLSPNKYQTPSKSAVSVTLTRQSDGKSWTFSGSESYTAAASGKYFNVETSGYGVSNCIIFRPDGVERYEGVYTVTITGLKTKSGAAATLSYQVDFFDPENPIPFSDVPAGAWYANEVLWAVDNGITTGTGDGTTFEPSKVCTHEEIITFLWRAAGEPAAAAQAPVTVAFWAQNAVNWAYGQRIIDAGFRSSALCTRADTVTYMWKAAGSPSAASSSFPDVPADAAFARAVNWAVSKGVTNGTGDGSVFSPNNTCDRAQIVTFLYRAYA